MEQNDFRVDKWLWAVRIFKTRSLAAEACKKSKVYINGDIAKPSKMIKVDDVIEVKKSPILYRYRVKSLLKSRVGAKLVEDYLEDITPNQEVVKLDMIKLNMGGHRDRGAGRPTKKERRLIDDWQQSDE